MCIRDRLWIACYNGHPECVELLLKAGANANATTIGGSTPLEVATNCCHQKCVELLLAAKPDDVVPSYVAATYNKREALSTLLGAELDRRGVVYFMYIGPLYSRPPMTSSRQRGGASRASSSAFFACRRPSSSSSCPCR